MRNGGLNGGLGLGASEFDILCSGGTWRIWGSFVDVERICDIMTIFIMDFVAFAVRCPLCSLDTRGLV